MSPFRYIVVLVLFLIVAVVEFYSFQAIKTITKQRYIYFFWVLISVLVVGNFLIAMLTFKKEVGQTNEIQFSTGLFITILVPKLFIVIVLFGEDVFRYVQQFLFSEIPTITGRRKFVSQLALGLATIPFFGFVYAIIKGKYNFKVIKYQLFFKDLPKSFDGFTITQITDIHSGSLDNKEKVSYAVDLINQQQSDVVLFTGDIVNNFAHEMNDWIATFNKIKAPVGKYSILGNHDYGDYAYWESKEKYKKNFEDIKLIHDKIGFDLLLNENRYIEKDGERIHLIGVENWGKNFKQVADLEKASKGICKEDFKILMTHDPSHWDEKVKKDDLNYQLTLSGHTHGMQFGIEIPGFFRWSPSQYVYKQWAGLYKEFGRYINVNRGFGFHAFPGRLGVWPEITVIELKKRE